MRATTRTVAVAGMSALALLTAACSSSDKGSSTTTGTAGKGGGRSVLRAVLRRTRSFPR